MYEKFKTVLKDRGVSVLKVSKSTDIYSQDIYSALRGEKKFYNGWKKRIAAYLEMPIEELFEEGE